MWRSAATAIFMISAIPCAAQTADTERLAIADAFDRAQLTKDRAAMERMTADDLVFIEGSGKRSGKKEFVEGWMAPGDSFDPITLVDRTVTVLGPDAFMPARRPSSAALRADSVSQANSASPTPSAAMAACGARCISRSRGYRTDGGTQPLEMLDFLCLASRVAGDLAPLFDRVSHAKTAPSRKHAPGVNLV